MLKWWQYISVPSYSIIIDCWLAGTCLRLAGEAWEPCSPGDPGAQELSLNYFAEKNLADKVRTGLGQGLDRWGPVARRRVGCA